MTRQQAFLEPRFNRLEQLTKHHFKFTKSTSNRNKTTNRKQIKTIVKRKILKIQNAFSMQCIAGKVQSIIRQHLRLTAVCRSPENALGGQCGRLVRAVQGCGLPLVHMGCPRCQSRRRILTKLRITPFFNDSSYFFFKFIVQFCQMCYFFS